MFKIPFFPFLFYPDPFLFLVLSRYGNVAGAGKIALWVFLFLYGCWLGVWYEILALLVLFILAFSSLLLLYVLCFVKFCKGESGLGNLRALGCLMTEK